MNSLSLSLLEPKRGLYLEADGGGAGRGDQHYRVELGKADHARLGGFFREIPHTFASDARNLFQGAGTSVLRLPAPLTTGSNSDAGIGAALGQVGESRLAVQREEASLSLALRLGERLTLSTRYVRQAREGSGLSGAASCSSSGRRIPRVSWRPPSRSIR